MYTDDHLYLEMLHGASRAASTTRPHPVDRCQRGLGSVGVHCVLTQADIPATCFTGWSSTTGLPLPAALIRRATSADLIALVVADTNELGPATLSKWIGSNTRCRRRHRPGGASPPDAPVFHPDRPDGNLLKHIKVRHGDPSGGLGFAAADVIVSAPTARP